MDWKVFIDEQVDSIRQAVGDGLAINALSGGVDSSVVTVLGHRALGLLYADAVPERGGVRIDLAEPLDAGVTGVIASVLTLLTGAAPSGGFKGIGGRFARRDLQRFGVELPLMLRFTRLDTGAAVDAGADTARVPADPELPGLMNRCLGGAADAEGQRRFATLWQDRVRRLLLDYWDDPKVFPVCAASAPSAGGR